MSSIDLFEKSSNLDIPVFAEEQTHLLFTLKLKKSEAVKETAIELEVGHILRDWLTNHFDDKDDVKLHVSLVDDPFRRSTTRDVTKHKSLDPLSETITGITRDHKPNLESIKHELAEIKKICNVPNEGARLMETIVKDMKQHLYDNHRGSVVAITYDRKIVESASNINEILEKMKNNPIPRDQFFIHEVL